MSGIPSNPPPNAQSLVTQQLKDTKKGKLSLIKTKFLDGAAAFGRWFIYKNGTDSPNALGKTFRAIADMAKKKTGTFVLAIIGMILLVALVIGFTAVGALSLSTGIPAVIGFLASMFGVFAICANCLQPKNGTEEEPLYIEQGSDGSQPGSPPSAPRYSTISRAAKQYEEDLEKAGIPKSALGEVKEGDEENSGTVIEKFLVPKSARQPDLVELAKRERNRLKKIRELAPDFRLDKDNEEVLLYHIHMIEEEVKRVKQNDPNDELQSELSQWREVVREICTPLPSPSDD
ncbi:MAG: MFS transporter [Puniceicoccales bacterium]|jgi:hypothetical protein|nr:MFS transporter [Puniceicoccales bacterium]